MIKVTCNEGHLKAEVDGNGLTIMSELCVVVHGVCETFMEGEENSEVLKNMMIIEVARALMRKVRDSEKGDK